MNYPKLRITVDRGERIFTRVELDGRQLPALRVAFDTGDMRDSATGLVSVKVEFYADLELVVENLGPVVTDVTEAAG